MLNKSKEINNMKHLIAKLEQAFAKCDAYYLQKIPTDVEEMRANWKQIKKDSAMCRMGIPDYIVTFQKKGENPIPISHTAEEYPVDEWQQVASPIWMDINQSNVLGYREAREEKDEKHICPLQLDVIKRCLKLWSKPGDTFLTPFMGIGSEVYEAVKYGLKPIGIELKESYYDQAVKYAHLAFDEKNENTLFSEAL